MTLPRGLLMSRRTPLPRRPVWRWIGVGLAIVCVITGTTLTVHALPAAEHASGAAAGVSGAPPADSSFSTADFTRGSADGGRITRAQLVTKVAPLDPPNIFGHLTLLESPVFGPDGDLYFVHSSAAPNQPKIEVLNLKTHRLRTLYTDATSTFGSMQFSPKDKKIYLTDLGGRIDRMNVDGTHFATLVSGNVLGRPMAADDLTFDSTGAMFVSDLSGSLLAPKGRVIRFQPDGSSPVLLAGGLAGANGISFDPQSQVLWVSEFFGGRIDRLTLSADHRSLVSSNVGMHEDVGTGGLDSNAVDSEGNIYQCLYGTGRVDVWSPTGKQLTTIIIPQTMPQPELLATNLAIRPGTHDGYLTVGGVNGGFIYRFRSLGTGIRQSNGG